MSAAAVPTPDGPREAPGEQVVQRDVQRERDEPGGDAVCWLDRVCDACGSLSDGPPAPACLRCGAPRDGC